MLNMKLTPLLMAICLTGGFASPAFAQGNNDATTDQLIKKINTRTLQLEAEVKQLRAQLVELKKSNNKKVVGTAPLVKASQGHVDSKNRRQVLIKMGATPVVSSPYIGVHSQYDASDLIVNIPSYNQDLQLLQQQKKMQDAFIQKGVKTPLAPVMVLSGKIEGQVSGNRAANGARSTNVDLSGTELDVIGHFTPWLTGFIALNYDNAAPNAGVVGGSTVTRTDNSRIFLNKAWITLGNLNVSPFYATIGQRFLFGQSTSFMISSPLTMLLTRIKARALSLGYQHAGDNGVYGTVYTFKGDSTTGNTNINQFGGTLGYQFKNNSFSSDIGVDYVSNIADSQGLQNTGNPGVFGGFGASSQFERLVNRVPAIAAHGRATIGSFFLVGEYTGAVKTFDQANLTFNGQGARPQAINVEGAYLFKAFDKPANFVLGYGQTRDALALNLPERRLISAFNISIWKDTIASLEFHRDTNYSTTDFATGQYAINPKTIVTTGRFSNTLTAQFGVYF